MMGQSGVYNNYQSSEPLEQEGLQAKQKERHMITKFNLRSECQDKFRKHMQQYIYVGNLDEAEEGHKMLDDYIDISVRIENDMAKREFEPECPRCIEQRAIDKAYVAFVEKRKLESRGAV